MDEQQLMKELGECELSPVGRLLFELVRNQFRIINRLDTIVDQNEKIMATQADLDAALQGEGTDLATVTTNLAALEAKLASITPGQPAPDLSAEVAQVATFRTALQAMATQISTDTTNLGSSSTPPAPAAGSTTTAAANVAGRKTV